MKHIAPEDLVPLNVFEADFPIRVDVVYANPDHPDNLHFKGLYHKDAAVIWAHKDLAVIFLLAAKIMQYNYGWTLKANDCLRPVDAQKAMESAHIHEMLLSKPGQGGHPRGMAIDVEPLDVDGKPVPMGTPFDFFVDDPSAHYNPAARNSTRFDGANHKEALEICKNRWFLTFAMLEAADKFGRSLKPVSQEWWDYRFHNDEIYAYEPLSEVDLHPAQRMMNPDVAALSEIAAGRFPHGLEKLEHTIAKVRKAAEQKFSDWKMMQTHPAFKKQSWPLFPH